MGSSKDGKPRLVKIVLPASRFVYTALKHAHTLRDQDSWKGVYVRKSMTPAQRELEAKMREFIRELRKKGPCDFVLYKGEVWHREDIKGRVRKTLPPSMPDFALSGNS